MSTAIGVDGLLGRIISNLPGAATITLPQALLLVLLAVILPPLLHLLHSEVRGDKARYRKLPGPKPLLPLIGSMLLLPKNGGELLHTFHRLSQQFRGFFYVSLTRDLIVINSPEAAEAVLGSNQHIDKGTGYKALVPWLGRGLLTSTGSKWHSRRKMLTPAFHFSILEQFLTVFNEHSAILVDKLHDTNAQKIDIFPFITKATLDVICEAAMGVQIGAQQGAHVQYVNAVQNMGMIVFERLTKPWLNNDFLYRRTPTYQLQKRSLKVLHGFTDSVIHARRQELARKSTEGTTVSQKKRKAFLDLMLASTIDGKPLNDAEIREEVDTFMFEGHDTTSAGINWTLYCLGRHPETQAKAYEELHNLLGDDKSSPITKSQLAEMNYLGMVIKESLRLFPPVPIIGRNLATDVVIDGYDVPKSGVVVQLYSIHRDPRHWPDPERFDPERFTPENSRGRHPYAYEPFSAGPRNCIGQKFALMEMRTVLAQILRSFEITAYQRREDLKLRADSILRLEGKLWLSFKPRH